MKLRALRITRLPGLRDGLTLAPEHLDGRVRVLHGPNAIGKSSLVRALKALLWPEAAPHEHLDLEATFDIAGALWRARRDGPTTRWTRDGLEVAPPTLPPWQHAGQLLVGLDDLAIDGAKPFEEHVQRELGGGYDLGAVEGELRRGVPSGRTQSRALADAEADLRAARSAQEAVQREAAQLDELRRERDAARAATARARQLETALDLARARASLAGAQARLSVFPAAMADLRGQEAEELEGLRRRIGAARDALAAARNEDSRLAREVTRLALAQPIAPAALDELDAHVEELRTADDTARSAREAAAAAATHLGAIERSFGPNADLERCAQLDAATAAEIEAFALAWDAATRLRAEFQAQLSAHGADSTAQEPAPRAVAALEDWLATPDAAPQDTRSRQALLVLGALLAALGAGLAFSHLAFLGLVVLGIVTFVLGRAPRQRAGAARRDHEHGFGQTGEAPPAAWTEDAVRARLAELRRQQAAAEEGRVRAKVREQIAAKLAQADQELRAVEARRVEFAARFGPVFTTPGAALPAFLRACEELRAARAAHDTNTQALGRQLQARDEALARLNSALAPFGAAAVADLTAARVRTKDLRSRNHDLAALLQQRGTQAEAMRRAEEEARQFEQEIAALFLRAGVPPGDEAELGRRLEQLPAWRDARARRDAAVLQVEDLRPRVAEDLAEATTASLDAELQAANALAAAAAQTDKRITEIETRLELARQGRALETAQGRRDTCRDALRTVFAANARAELASALLADVREAHESTSRPEVVEAADRLFTRFTRGRYALVATMSEGRLVLAARDARDAGEAFGLGALSDGTRAQLLLAARLAYLTRLERETTREPLPVVLDDALATSDPARKQEIGRALLEVARRQDRQFLVLTTDAADVELLRPDDAEPGEVQATDLKAVRAMDVRVAARERERVPEPAAVPDLAGLSEDQRRDALAAAGMPVFELDPFRPVDDAHVFRVLSHEPAILRRALELRLDTVGVLRNATRAGLAGLGEREWSAAAPFVALAEAVLGAWRVGRGRPIDRQVLLDAGVSKTFIDRMAELACDLGGDARAWYCAVRDKTDKRARNYQESVLEANRQHLLDKGYLDEREPLAREDAWVRVLGAMPEDHGIPAPELRRRFEVLWRACGG